MEKGTPVGKLKGIKFFVFLYALENPRYYEGVGGTNTLGFGYYGKHGSDMREGLWRIASAVEWLKEHIPEFRKKYGINFADQSQFEVFRHLKKDLSTTVEYTMLPREEIEDWIKINFFNKKKRNRYYIE